MEDKPWRKMKTDPKECGPEALDIENINAELSDTGFPILAIPNDFFKPIIDYIKDCPANNNEVADYSDPASVQKKKLTSTVSLLGPRVTFSQAEQLERDELVLLRDTWVSNIRWQLIRTVTESNIPGNVKAKVVNSQLTSFDEEVIRITFHKMTTYVDNHFHCIFPMGLESSGMGDRDVLALVDALVNMSSIFDPDMETMTFACTPGMKFTVDHVPPPYKPMFYVFAAMKSAVQLAGVTQDEMFDFAVMYYHDKSVPLSPTVKNCFLLMDTSVEMLFGTKQVAPMITQFYEECRQLEVKLKSDCCDTINSDKDNTIAVDYQKGEAVGKGSFGTVFRCVNVKNGKFLALKELPLKDCKDTEQEIRVEIDTLKSLNHNNIVKYYGCKFDRERRKVSILMEYAPKSLRDVLLECHGLTISLISHYSRKILEGLVYLHAKHVIHRDIKAANVLVTDSGDIKLSDFGSAVLYSEALDTEPINFDANASEAEVRSLDINSSVKNVTGNDTVTMTVGGQADDMSDGEEAEQQQALRRKLKAGKAKRAIVGTPLFMAPEVLKGALPNESSDIWAFGCLLIELVTGKHPWLVEFGGENLPVPLTMYRISQSTKPPQLPQELSSQISEDFSDFLYQCLNLDPNMRPNARQLLQHPFLGGLNGPQRHGSTSSSGGMSSSSNNSMTGMSHHMGHTSSNGGMNTTSSTDSTAPSTTANPKGTTSTGSLKQFEDIETVADNSGSVTPQSGAITPQSKAQANKEMFNNVGDLLKAHQDGSTTMEGSSMGNSGMMMPAKDSRAKGEVLPPAAHGKDSFHSPTGSSNKGAGESTAISTLQTDWSV